MASVPVQGRMYSMVDMLEKNVVSPNTSAEMVFFLWPSVSWKVILALKKKKSNLCVCVGGGGSDALNAMGSLWDESYYIFFLFLIYSIVGLLGLNM